MMVLLKRLWRQINAKRKKQLGLITVLMLMASISELVSIGAVVPFLGVLANPEVVFRDYAVLYLSKDQIEKKIETYQNKIQDEANEFINKLNVYHEEVNKKILDIRDKYNVS